MARAGALLLLLALLAATLCVSEVAASRQLTGGNPVDLVDVDLKPKLYVFVSIGNECGRDVVVTLLEDLKHKEDAKNKVVEVKEGAEGSLGPIQVRLAVANLLKLHIALLGDDGKLLTVVVKVDLNKVERLLSGLVKVVLHLVYDVDAKLVKVLLGEDVLAYINVGIKL